MPAQHRPQEEVRVMAVWLQKTQSKSHTPRRPGLHRGVRRLGAVREAQNPGCGEQRGRIK